MAVAVVPAVSVISAVILIALMIRRPVLWSWLQWILALPFWILGLLRWIPGLRWTPQVLRIPVLLLMVPEIALDQWRAIDAETVRDPGDAGMTSATVLMVLVTVAGSLTLQEYLGG